MKHHSNTGIRGLPGIVLAIDASLWHLTQNDCELLREMADVGIDDLPRTAGHEYGWTLFLTGNEEENAREIDAALKTHEVGQGLVELIKYGMNNGAYMLNLDADGEVIQNFPVFARDGKKMGFYFRVPESVSINALVEGHWYRDAKSILYIVPDPSLWDGNTLGANQEKVCQLNHAYKKMPFYEVDPKKLANQLGLTYVNANNRDFDFDRYSFVGYLSA